MGTVRKLSKVIGPFVEGDLKSTCKSQKLFSQLGLARSVNGLPVLSPILIKSLRKLETIVRKNMDELSALEVSLPALISSDLLKVTGRIDMPDLFKFEWENDKSLALSPTCEETVTEYISSGKPLKSKELSCRLYQISKKFRDEKRVKFGLLRTREFIMKDLYCFDASPETSENTYQEVIKKYNEFFKNLNIPYVSVMSLPGFMGGLKSEEFHFLSEAGDDSIAICQECGFKENMNKVGRENKCLKCQSTNVKISKGIEVGHAFSLGTIYTKPFEASYLLNNQKEILHMSCFGLGLTRLLAASVEMLATENEIRWPIRIAPYLVGVIPPKKGSHEEEGAKNIADLVYHDLSQFLPEDVVVDDRTYLTIGNRINKLKKMGFPFIVVIGQDILKSPPMVEVIDVYTGSVDLIQVPDACQFIQKKLLGMYEGINTEKSKCFSSM